MGATSSPTFGLVGNGQLGGAIATALLSTGVVDPARLWIANRSGDRRSFAGVEGIRWTTELAEIAAHCDVILMALPPAAVADVAFAAPDALVVSVMAGIDAARLARITSARRVVRAMSNPAAALSLAYSPWFASSAVTAADRALVRRLFEACGTTDEVSEEGQIDCFTAVTGPVPGFVALFADCMAQYAIGRGVAPAVAERAIRQLFLAAGTMLAASDRPAGDHVEEMIRYAGTTAAGLLDMQASGLADAIAHGLEAARLRATTIGRD